MLVLLVLAVLIIDIFTRVLFDKVEFDLALSGFLINVVRHFFELAGHHLLVEPMIGVSLGKELLVDDLKSVADSVVLSFECPATG